MPENEIRPGESIAAWRARIAAQNKVKQETANLEAEQSRRRLANAAGEEYFEEIDPLVFTDEAIPHRNWFQRKWDSIWNNRYMVKGRYALQHLPETIQYLRNKRKNKNAEEELDLENVPKSFIPGKNVQPFFADLTHDAYATVGKGTESNIPSDANSIWFNHFYDSTNPQIHKAGKWRRLSGNTPLRDYNHIPLKDIKLFYGVENGTGRMAPLSEFNDTTTVVPIYYSSDVGIDSITGLPNQRFRKKLDEYQHQYDSLSRKLATFTEQKDAIINAHDHQLDSIYQKSNFGQFLPDSTYEDRLTSRITSRLNNPRQYNLNTVYPSFYGASVRDTNDIRHYFDYGELDLDKLGEGYGNMLSEKGEYDWNNPQIMSLRDSINSIVYPRRPERFQVNYNNGVSEDRFRGSGDGYKYLLGNKYGSFFMSSPTKLFEMWPQYADTLNNFIKKYNEPLYWGLVDQGSYADRSSDITDPQQGYLDYHWYKNEPYPLYYVGSRGNTNRSVPVEEIPSEKQGGQIPKFQKAGVLPSASVDQYTNNPAPMQFPDWKDGQKCPTGECAFFSNSQLRDYFGVPAYGNAWELNGNPLFYNLTPKPVSFSKESYLKYLHNSADNFASGFDFNQLDPNKLYQVNMYYNTSPSLAKAYPTGNGTHAGYLQFKDGNWNVVHNIHGEVHVDQLKDVLGGNQKSYGLLNVYEVPKFNRANAYRKQLSDYTQKNPMGLWGEDAEKQRAWLRKNYPEDLENYWNSLTEEQRKKVDRRFKP